MDFDILTWQSLVYAEFVTHQSEVKLKIISSNECALHPLSPFVPEMTNANCQQTDLETQVNQRDSRVGSKE